MLIYTHTSYFCIVSFFGFDYFYMLLYLKESVINKKNNNV